MAFEFCQLPNRSFPGRAHPLRSLVCGVAVVVSTGAGGEGGGHGREGRQRRERPAWMLAEEERARRLREQIAREDEEIIELLPVFCAMLNRR